MFYSINRADVASASVNASLTPLFGFVDVSYLQHFESYVTLIDRELCHINIMWSLVRDASPREDISRI